MVKKNIASVLVILILINSIGCTSYNQIKKEDTKKIEESDKVKITTLDSSVYYLTDVEVQKSVIKGTGTVLRNDIEYLLPICEIRFEDIYKIEAGEIDALTPILILLGIGCAGVIIYFAILMATYEK